MFRSVKLGENSENLALLEVRTYEVFDTRHLLHFLYILQNIFFSGGLGWWTASLEKIQASPNDWHRTVSGKKI